jgi:hypothetical protein
MVMKRKPNSTINEKNHSWELVNDLNRQSTVQQFVGEITRQSETPTKSGEDANAPLTEAALENHSETSLGDGSESTFTTVPGKQSTAAKTDLNSQLGALSSSSFSATESSGLTQAIQTKETSNSM